MLRESETEFGQNDEEESPLSKSPEVRNKKHKFLKFKNILNYLLVSWREAWMSTDQANMEKGVYSFVCACACLRWARRKQRT